MKIFHTGDVHLDSPFKNIDRVRAEERRREIRKTFSDMMTYCAENRVDLVLISGDLFDNEFVTRETVGLLQRCFGALECPVVIAPGNHDPAEEDSIWTRADIFPDNVCVFCDEGLSYFPFDSIGVDVYGWAFTSRFMRECPLTGMHPERDDRINLLCAHGDTTSPISVSCPLPPAALRDFGADWCALGHIHTPDAANAAISDIGAYCGCPEGRDFGECGAKSAVLITIDENDGKKTVSHQKLFFAKRTYYHEELRCDGAADRGEIETKLIELVSAGNFGKDALLRVTLCGSVSPSLSINTAELAKCADVIYYTEVIDKTSPDWDSEFLSADRGIRGELYRELLPLLESADPEERKKGNRALRYALAALNGEDIAEL